MNNLFNLPRIEPSPAEPEPTKRGRRVVVGSRSCERPSRAGDNESRPPRRPLKSAQGACKFNVCNTELKKTFYRG